MDDKEASSAFTGQTPEQRMMTYGAALGDLAVLRARVLEELEKPADEQMMLPADIVNSIDTYAGTVHTQRNEYLDSLAGR